MRRERKRGRVKRAGRHEWGRDEGREGEGEGARRSAHNGQTATNRCVQRRYHSAVSMVAACRGASSAPINRLASVSTCHTGAFGIRQSHTGNGTGSVVATNVHASTVSIVSCCRPSLRAGERSTRRVDGHAAATTSCTSVQTPITARGDPRAQSTPTPHVTRRREIRRHTIHPTPHHTRTTKPQRIETQPSPTNTNHLIISRPHCTSHHLMPIPSSSRRIAVCPRIRYLAHTHIKPNRTAPPSSRTPHDRQAEPSSCTRPLLHAWP